jgi:hypothetical protein
MAKGINLLQMIAGRGNANDFIAILDEAVKLI